MASFSKDSPLQRRYEELRATKGYGKGKVTDATDLVWLERATYTEVLEVHCGTARGQQLVAKIPETFWPRPLGDDRLCLPLHS